jgi:hypothetical protein
MTDWVPVMTNAAGAGGFFDFVDPAAMGLSRRIYRSRLAP